MRSRCGGMVWVASHRVLADVQTGEQGQRNHAPRGVGGQDREDDEDVGRIDGRARRRGRRTTGTGQASGARMSSGAGSVRGVWQAW